jgi:alpha-D-ribose 1-methylphosphonate 5-triphosphate synthase subunit PhnI
MSDFIEGAIVMGNAVAALFFLRFFRKTRDRLLAVFSLSFSLMAVVRLVHVLGRVPSEHVHYVYLIRLLAYLLIIYAIVDKNRAPGMARK